MAESAPPQSDDDYLRKVIEASVRLALLAALAAWCFFIIRPFITPVIWGAIIAVAIFPAYRWVVDRLGGRQTTAAVLFSIAGLAVVIVPASLFTGSLIESAHGVVASVDAEALAIPPPPSDVKEWPLVGPSVFKFWQQASVSLEPVIEQFAPQLKEVALKLLSAGVGVGLAILQSLISIVIAGVLLAGSTGRAQAVTRVAGRLTSGRGEQFTKLATNTVRSVAVGIVGVAIIQSALIGLGLVLFGVPHAGVWTLICLMLAIVQLPPLLVVLPIIVYMFSASSTTAAVAFTVYELLASGSDNVLKPILLARGVEVPMIVIFMGAIGGFMSSGFIGLFIGAVILSLGYDLSRAWVLGISAGATEGAEPPG